MELRLLFVLLELLHAVVFVDLVRLSRLHWPRSSFCWCCSLRILFGVLAGFLESLSAGHILSSIAFFESIPFPHLRGQQVVVVFETLLGSDAANQAHSH